METITSSVKEVATYIGISESSVYKLVRENRIPHHRVLSKILFSKTKIDEWFENNNN